MASRAEWRTGTSGEIILVIDDDNSRVRSALRADESLLSRFLTSMDDVSGWTRNVTIHSLDPEEWGELVLSRAVTGEVLTVDPELFWDRIHRLFRAHGVDYE